MAFATLKNKKRVTWMLVIALVGFFALIARLFYVQIVRGSYYKEKAYSQQTKDRTVAASRGTIYDCNKNKLALSVSTNTLTVAPTNIEEKDKEKIAKDISEIIKEEYDTVLSKLNKTVSLVTIKTNIGEEIATKLSNYILENDLKGIYVDESTNRIYPYNSLLSHVLGFTGTDDQGLYGLEAYYEEELAGIDGRIIGSIDGGGNETPYEEEEYVAPQNGNSLVLTVDATIQSIVEKNLEKAVKENIADKGACVVMRPTTGEILAMATYPDFDLNSPFEINNEELKAKWDTLSSKEKNNALLDMWRNTAISDAFEPGSTFKVLTASAALEENITDIDTAGTFNCNGYLSIAGWKIRCWRYPRTHGSQSLRQAIMNSCNPSFMQAGLKLGIETYTEYLKAYNLYDRTGIDLPGETTGIIHDPKTMTELDLATTSFGQTISITALQSAVMYSAIANGGKIMQPYVVKEIRAESGALIKETTPTVKKQVISETTAAKILSALYDTVDKGTGKAAKVSGYTVAGKTGTAEEGRGSNGWYMASFAGIAPVNDPELVVIFNIYDPKGPQGHQGGTICAPVVGNIIDETLRYMDVNPSYTVEETTTTETIVTDVTGKTYAEAKKIITDVGFKIASDDSIKDDEIIKEQIPKAGASLTKGATIRVYTDTEATKETTTVPDVRSYSQTKATSKLKSAGLNIRIIGKGNAIIQDPSPGEVVTKGSIVTVKFVDTTDIH